MKLGSLRVVQGYKDGWNDQRSLSGCRLMEMRSMLRRGPDLETILAYACPKQAVWNKHHCYHVVV